jgi:hypothetical protein
VLALTRPTGHGNVRATPQAQACMSGNPQPTGYSMKTKALALVAVLFASSFLASSAHATVLRVIAVETENVDAYVKAVEKGQAIIKKAGGSATLRVWRARYAGTAAGTVIVSVEYPDLSTLASDEKKLNANDEYQTWFKGLAKVRKITSDSLYDELKSTM